jgi:hypothetical protein
MSSALRELPALLSLLGITEEGLADVSANELEVALQRKGIFELEECRRVRSAWRGRQKRSGELFKLLAPYGIRFSSFVSQTSFIFVVCEFLASFFL